MIYSSDKKLLVVTNIVMFQFTQTGTLALGVKSPSKCVAKSQSLPKIRQDLSGSVSCLLGRNT